MNEKILSVGETSLPSGRRMAERSMVKSVLIAPDSFKGTLAAEQAAEAIAAGWRRRRPADVIRCLPQADGGEGTADAIASSVPDARWREVEGVRGPLGSPVRGRWLELPDRTAVVELAQMSGITLVDDLDPDRATTYGFGEVIRAALRAGARELILCLGGSASTDGGAGAMQALGARLRDSLGSEIPHGAIGLDALDSVDLADVVAGPPRGVTVLTDVTAPLLGPTGAAAVFGPQKGIASGRIAEFDARLQRFAEAVVVGSPHASGAGAAGGTAFGLACLWPVEITSGASYIAARTGLTAAMPEADLLITGEGRYDDQSTVGKVIGQMQISAAAHGVTVAIVAGRLMAATDGPSADLSVLAGSADAAMKDPARWATVAGEDIARQYENGLSAT